MATRRPFARRIDPSRAAAVRLRSGRLLVGACGLLGLLAIAPAVEHPAAAQPADAAADLHAMEETDRAFAHLSRQQGMKAAFLAYMAPDAVLFRPGPVSGPAYIGARPNPAIELIWAPVHGAVARSGDLGYTTGPYEVRDADATHKVEDTGWYVTLWRKQSDGSWKLIADQGVSTPPPAGAAAEQLAAAGAGQASAGGPEGATGGAMGAAMAPPSSAAAAAPAADAAAGPVMRADRDFAGDANVHGARAAYMTVLAPAARLYRDDAAPVEGREAIGKALTGRQPNPGGQATAGGLSAAGDLGFTYGTTAVTGPAALSKSATAAAPTSMYLRLWQRQDGGKWAMILDLVKPLPPTATEVHH